jgi:hypothetical protein
LSAKRFSARRVLMRNVFAGLPCAAALQCLDLERDGMAQGEILHAEQKRSALCSDIIAQFVGQFDHQARSFAAHGAQAVIGENRAQVLLELIDEAPAITPLERDFVVSADEVSHDE